jgi:hypothetical protein
LENFQRRFDDPQLINAPPIPRFLCAACAPIWISLTRRTVIRATEKPATSALASETRNVIDAGFDSNRSRKETTVAAIGSRLGRDGAKSKKAFEQ